MITWQELVGDRSQAAFLLGSLAVRAAVAILADGRDAGRTSRAEWR